MKRVLLIGTVYPYGYPTTPLVTESHSREPLTFKGKMRKQQEDVLLKAHAAGRIQGTILRLPDFYGPGVTASFLHSLFEAAAHGGTANLVGPIDVPTIRLCARCRTGGACACGEAGDCLRTLVELRGAGSITQQQIATEVFAMAGRKAKFRVAGKSMLRLMALFSPLMRELVEMHYLMTNPVLMGRIVCFVICSAMSTRRRTRRD